MHHHYCCYHHSDKMMRMEMMNDGDFCYDDENGDNERNVSDMMVNMIMMMKMVKAVVSRFLPKECYNHHRL